MSHSTRAVRESQVLADLIRRAARGLGPYAGAAGLLLLFAAAQSS